jgi:hypothetical protein
VENLIEELVEDLPLNLVEELAVDLLQDLVVELAVELAEDLLPNLDVLDVPEEVVKKVVLDMRLF